MASLSAVSSSPYASGITHGAVTLATNKYFVLTTLALVILDNLPKAEAIPFSKCMEWCTSLPMGSPLLLGGGCIALCTLGLVIPVGQ